MPICYMSNMYDVICCSNSILAFELWFKQVLFDLDTVIETFNKLANGSVSLVGSLCDWSWLHLNVSRHTRGLFIMPNFSFQKYGSKVNLAYIIQNYKDRYTYIETRKWLYLFKHVWLHLNYLNEELLSDTYFSRFYATIFLAYIVSRKFKFHFQDMKHSKAVI